MHGLTSLYEIPPEVLAQMQVLVELDLRQNVLRHMKARLLKGPPVLERVYLSGKLLISDYLIKIRVE